MNRKLIAGAAAALLIPASLGVMSAGAKAAKASITSVAFTSQSPTLGFSETSGQIAPYQTATLTITGSNLPTGATGSTFSSWKTKGVGGLYLGGGLTINSVTTSTSSSFVASVTGPGKSLLHSQTKGDAPGTVSFKFGAAKGSFSLVSNCGPTLPAVATAGLTYGTASDGTVDVSGGSTGTQVGLTYFDVNTLGFNLCADDIGSAASTGFPTFAANYPVGFTSTGASSSSVSGIGFSFPYTTNRTLNVTNTAISYKLNNLKKGTCSIPSSQPSGIDASQISCSFKKNVLTVTSSQGLTYHKDDVISGPRVSFAVTKTLAPGAVTVTPLGDSSTISLDGLSVAINFAPRAGSSSATYTVASTS